MYVIKTKDEVLDYFLKWKTMVENQTGKKIKSLQPDSGMEYINDLLVKLCQVNCII